MESLCVFGFSADSLAVEKTVALRISSSECTANNEQHLVLLAPRSFYGCLFFFFNFFVDTLRCTSASSVSHSSALLVLRGREHSRIELFFFLECDALRCISFSLCFGPPFAYESMAALRKLPPTAVTFPSGNTTRTHTHKHIGKNTISWLTICKKKKKGFGTLFPSLSLFLRLASSK